MGAFGSKKYPKLSIGHRSNRRETSQVNLTRNSNYNQFDLCFRKISQYSVFKNIDSIVVTLLLLEFMGLPKKISLFICDLMSTKHVVQPFRIKYSEFHAPHRGLMIYVHGVSSSIILIILSPTNPSLYDK
jgi:hypothetical protein